MFENIVNNFFGYDLIIIILAIFNGVYVYPKLKKESQSLKKSLQKTVYLPVQKIYEKLDYTSKGALNLHDLQAQRDEEVKYYQIFDTINSLFPMLGILGTIIALLKMVTLDQLEVMSNFTVALTSTFWGLVFGIVFKALEGSILVHFSSNRDQMAFMYERIDHYVEGTVDHEE